MENIEKDLNLFLSDLNVFYRKLQNYHWNITGEHFFVLHAKLEEYYDEINSQIDEVAEHMLMLGKQPLGTMKDYLEKTTIVEAQNNKVTDKEILNNIINDYNTLLQEVTELKSLAEEKNLYSTSTLMDDLISSYTKHLWMLKQVSE